MQTYKDENLVEGSILINNSLNDRVLRYSFNKIDSTLTVNGTCRVAVKSAVPNWLKIKDDVKRVVLGDEVIHFCREILDIFNKVEEIVVDENNTEFTSLDGVLFTKDMKSLLAYPIGNSNENYIIPDGVEDIREYSFKGCKSLKSVTIPQGVRFINGEAFMDCTSLESIHIPSSVIWIDWSAFGNCTALKNIDLADTIQVIEYNAFYNTAWYNTQPDGVVYLNNYVLGHKGDMSEDTDLIFLENTIGIANEAFENYSEIKSITFPKGLKFVGWSAFQGCTSLERVTFPDEVREILQHAFADCYNLKSVIMPSSAEFINPSVFKNCISLETICVPNGIDNVYEETFKGCISLKDVTIPKSINSIDVTAFEGCGNIDAYYMGTRSEWKNVKKYKKGWDIELIEDEDNCEIIVHCIDD